MTPHINAKKGEIAKFVLMPGDPLRAEHIATSFLENVKKVNTVRNMFMFTGTYKGKRVTVAGSGMGQPSIGIYAYELFNFYGVTHIVRVGSCGSYKRDLKLYETVLAKEAYSDSTVFAKAFFGKDEHKAFPDPNFNETITRTARRLNIKTKELNVHTSDVFYAEPTNTKTLAQNKVDCVEMESYALFTIAHKLDRKAACLLTVSDNLVTKEETSAKQRQNSFNDMIQIALETALEF